MNRANQHALFQQTNQGLLNIRQSEINYYISLNVAFGTQAALIGGFTYGIFTQNQPNESTVYSKWFQDVYWVTSSGTIAASVHVILTTMLLQVLGPGLALHGPIGSMARAAEGMRFEQKFITTAFIVMMLMFSISTVLSFWVVMTLEAATVATFLWMIACRYYYFYSERIVLRFYWKEEIDHWKRTDSDNPVQDEDGDEPPNLSQANNQVNMVHGLKSSNANSNALITSPGVGANRSTDQSTDRTLSTTKDKQNPITGMLRGLFPSSGNQSITSNPNLQETLNPMGEDNPASKKGGKGMAMEGFFSVMQVDNTWERRYFTLNYAGRLYYYKDRLRFRNNPREPLHKRPLILFDFFIEIYNSETQSVEVNETRRSSGGSTVNHRQSVGTATCSESVVFPRSNSWQSGNAIVGGNIHRAIFQIRLIPKENEELMMLQKDQPGLNLDETYSSFNGSNNNGEQTVKSNNNNNKEQVVLRRDWVFRCDTAEELTLWQEVMQEISPSSFR
jgi:hypothetical protein